MCARRLVTVEQCRYLLAERIEHRQPRGRPVRQGKTDRRRWVERIRIILVQFQARREIVSRLPDARCRTQANPVDAVAGRDIERPPVRVPPVAVRCLSGDQYRIEDSPAGAEYPDAKRSRAEKISQ